MTAGDAIKDILIAISDPGPNPEYHHRIMTRHRMEWPTLWQAIDRLIAEYDD